MTSTYVLLHSHLLDIEILGKAGIFITVRLFHQTNSEMDKHGGLHRNRHSQVSHVTLSAI